MARILIVDDEESIRITVSEIIKEGGHEVQTAEDVPKAFELMEVRDFDVIVTDIIMPKVTGVELLRKVHETSPEIPIVMMTGEPEVRSASEAVRAGAFDYLSKPISRDAIMKVVRNAVEVKALNDEKKRLEEENLIYQEHLEELVEERTRALRESEERFDLAVKGSSDGLWDWPDISKDEQWWSLQWYELMEYNDGEIKAGFSKFTSFLHQDDFVRVSEAIRTHFDEHEPFDLEYRLKTKSGEYRWFRGRGQALWDDNGNAVRMSGSIQDITVRKEAEEERKRLTNELMQRKKELEQIIYVSSHDLRSPLVNVHGFSNELSTYLEKVESILLSEDVPRSIKEQLSPLIDEDIPDALGYIQMGISKIDSLNTALLRISRLGTTSLNIEDLDMNELMSDIEDSIQYQTREKGINLEIGELPDCKGDKNQINQVFSNLIDNSIKFLDPTRSGIIKVSGHREDGKVVFCVEDNGVGIAPEYQKKIFELFHRLKPSESTGEGLGLTIVSRILDRHIGNIWVESEVGKGSRFYVSLPEVVQ